MSDVTSITLLWSLSSAASLILTAAWLLNTYKRLPHLASPFHHFFSFILVFRSIHITAIALYYAISLEEFKLYFALMEAVSFTLYNSFLFLVLVVLSKGFMTLRHSFTREEFGKFTCYLGIFYLVFGVYRMNVDKLQWGYLIVVLLCAVYCFKEMFESLRIANQYVSQLRRHLLHDMSASAIQKLTMLRIFSWILVFFYLNEAIHPALALYLPKESAFALSVSYNSCEFLSVASLTLIFRVQTLDPFFGIVDFYDWPEEVEWRPAEMYQATIGNNDISLRTDSFPVLIELPCDAETKKFKFENYEIGQLEVPLLGETV